MFKSLQEGEVNRCSYHRLDASGKGVNVTRILTEAGYPAIHLTHLGGSRKREMLDLLALDGIEVLWTDSESPIRTCTTIINVIKHTATELVEESYPVNPNTEKEIRQLFTKVLSSVTWVVITGTRASGYTENLYSDWVLEAKLAGKHVILDVRGDDLLSCISHRPDVIKPNLSEFVTTFFPAHQLSEQEESVHLKPMVREKLKELYDTYGISSVITRGAAPLWKYDAQGFSEITVLPVEPVNTIGCGDALTAGLAGELGKDKSLNDAIAIGLEFARENAQQIRPGSIGKISIKK
jgi:fructose-1-phosphate kinase PfkB-like protein